MLRKTMIVHQDGTTEIVNVEVTEADIIPPPDPSPMDVTLELLAEHEERLCMLELTAG